MFEFNVMQKIAIWVLPALFAITVHEVAHGWVAKQLGDPTAMMLGRLTLNPIKHIDPFGTVIIPLAMLLLTGFVFGWARPVPITWENLRHPKRDMTLVAAAGPLANLLMAAFWTVVLKIGMGLSASVAGLGLFLVGAGVAGIFINAVLMFLNLVPLPPLDGGRVLVGLLPDRAGWVVSQVEPYGLIIIVVLLVTGALGALVLPPIEFMMLTFSELAGVSPGLLKSMLVAVGVLG